MNETMLGNVLEFNQLWPSDNDRFVCHNNGMRIYPVRKIHKEGFYKILEINKTKNDDVVRAYVEPVYGYDFYSAMPYHEFDEVLKRFGIVPFNIDFKYKCGNVTQMERHILAYIDEAGMFISATTINNMKSMNEISICTPSKEKELYSADDYYGLYSWSARCTHYAINRNKCVTGWLHDMIDRCKELIANPEYKYKPSLEFWNYGYYSRKRFDEDDAGYEKEVFESLPEDFKASLIKHGYSLDCGITTQPDMVL